MTRALAEEFRRKAQECFDLARAVSLNKDRDILVNIAQTYLRLAKQYEAPADIVTPPVTEQSQPVAQQQEQIQSKEDDTKE